MLAHVSQALFSLMHLWKTVGKYIVAVYFIKLRDQKRSLSKKKNDHNMRFDSSQIQQQRKILGQNAREHI